MLKRQVPLALLRLGGGVWLNPNERAIGGGPARHEIGLEITLHFPLSRFRSSKRLATAFANGTIENNIPYFMRVAFFDTLPGHL